MSEDKHSDKKDAQPAGSQPEQRQEYRLAKSEAVYIELEAELDDELGSILLSRCTDLSANGLQVLVDRALPVGNIYSLSVQLQDPRMSFTLAGEVKWCDGSGGEYRIGIALFESDGTEIIAWKEEVARRL